MTWMPCDIHYRRCAGNLLLSILPMLPITLPEADRRGIPPVSFIGERTVGMPNPASTCDMYMSDIDTLVYK